jgi:hypothetical protein
LGGAFLKLAHSFVDKAIERIDPEEPDGARFKEYYRAALQAVTEENAAEIAAAAQSPIEKMFLNSLLLSFIKNDGLGLLVHPTYNDSVAEIANFRKNLVKWREFFLWFREKRPANSIEEFLDSEVRRGAMCAEERRASIRYIFRYGYIPMDGSYHMSIQPPFPNVRVNGKPIRPDIYFWIPNKPQINIVVECDGFHYHSDKETFITDRQRDRALKALGYDVLRFSGSEIFKDLVHAPYELATYLWERARDEPTATH